MSQTPTPPELLNLCAVRQIAHVVLSVQVQAINSHVPVAV